MRTGLATVLVMMLALDHFVLEDHISSTAFRFLQATASRAADIGSEIL